MKTVATLIALTVTTALAAAAPAADKLQLVVGQPFAVLGTEPSATTANMKANAKNAAMAVRADGCSNVSTLRLTATAEGTAAGKRRTAPLSVVAAAPGAFTIARPQETGAWVVALVATCGKLTAGGLVPLLPNGATFDRAHSTFYERAPTAAEIEKAVKDNAAR